MSYVIGIILAFAICILALQPTVLIVVASYCVLFAVIGGADGTLLAESVVMGVFAVIAVVGFSRNLWLVVAGLAAHGAFDAVRGGLFVNPGVPAWWPAFCLTFDVTAAAFLALLLQRRRGLAVPSP